MEHSNSKKALVSGGAGFLGPHLIQLLLARRWEVLAMDNFSTGVREHIAPFLPHPGFRLAEGDITDRAFVEETVASFRPEVMYHLAAIHFIPYCVSHPAETLHVNVVGTQRLLDAVQETGAGRFILASTGDVYAPSRAPHAESSPLGPSNVYGLSKLFAEQLLSLAERKHPRARFLTARLFNLIGPGETNPHVLPDILAGLRRGGALRLGNMEPLRDYIYVGDAAEALVRLGTYKGDKSVFNVGTGVGRSVRDLVRTLEKIRCTTISVETDHAKVRMVERQRLVADISRIRDQLAWEPSVPLEEGLRTALEAAELVMQG